MTIENEPFSIDLGKLQLLSNHFRYLAKRGVVPGDVRNTLRYIEEEAPDQWQVWSATDEANMDILSEKNLHQRLVNLVIYMKTHEKSEAAEYAIPELQSMIRSLQGEGKGEAA